jgi:hypothetical protein
MTKSIHIIFQDRAGSTEELPSAAPAASTEPVITVDDADAVVLRISYAKHDDFTGDTRPSVKLADNYGVGC